MGEWLDTSKLPLDTSADFFALKPICWVTIPLRLRACYSRYLYSKHELIIEYHRSHIQIQRTHGSSDFHRVYKPRASITCTEYSSNSQHHDIYNAIEAGNVIALAGRNIRAVRDERSDHVPAKGSVSRDVMGHALKCLRKRWMDKEDLFEKDLNLPVLAAMSPIGRRK